MTAETTQDTPTRPAGRPIEPGPETAKLSQRRAKAVAHAITSSLPVYIESASAGLLRDVDGHELIDLSSGIAVTNVGNAAPEVVARVQEQVMKFTHTCFLLAPYAGYVEVCERLNALTPGDFDKRSALFNSGAEAVENAVKFARAFTGRSAIIAMDHAFHGRTNLAMAMTAKHDPYKKGFGPFASEIYRAPMSYPFRDGDLSGQEAAQRAIEVIARQAGSENVAAVILEPIQGEGGFIVPAKGFAPGLAAWCREHGILFVADEIQTGFGRTGDMFASEYEAVVPDLVITAKGIAGGLPLSAVTGRAEIMDCPQPGGIGGTYSGNPLACAAALGSLEAMVAHDLVARARTIGDQIRSRLDVLADGLPFVGEVRGRGAMQALEFVRPGTKEPAPEILGQVLSYCHANGVVALAAGTYGNVLRLLPPLVIPDEILAEGLQVVEEGMRRVGAGTR